MFRHPKGDASGNEHHQLFPDASVDLVYLDPPFNFYPVYGTNANYNVLFNEASGEADGINRIAYL